MRRRPLPNVEPGGSPSTLTAVKAVAYIIQGKRGWRLHHPRLLTVPERSRGFAA